MVLRLACLKPVSCSYLFSWWLLKRNNIEATMEKARGKMYVWGGGDIIVKRNCTHHRASRCSISLRKFVWNLCKGSKFGNMRLFSVSGMESSLLTALWNHWKEKEATLRSEEMNKSLQFRSDATATCARSTGASLLGLQPLGGPRDFQASLLVPLHPMEWEALISSILLPVTGYRKNCQGQDRSLKQAAPQIKTSI